MSQERKEVTAAFSAFVDKVKHLSNTRINSIITARLSVPAVTDKLKLATKNVEGLVKDSKENLSDFVDANLSYLAGTLEFNDTGTSEKIQDFFQKTMESRLAGDDRDAPIMSPDDIVMIKKIIDEGIPMQARTKDDTADTKVLITHVYRLSSADTTELRQVIQSLLDVVPSDDIFIEGFQKILHDDLEARMDDTDLSDSVAVDLANSIALKVLAHPEDAVLSPEVMASDLPVEDPAGEYDPLEKIRAMLAARGVNLPATTAGTHNCSGCSSETCGTKMPVNE